MTPFYEDPLPQVLQIHVDLLLALSLFFAEGGEKLPKTIESLIKPCTAFNDHYNLDSLFLARKTLIACLKSMGDDDLLMTYEFNRLFIGPTSPEAPPYESVYLSPDHLVMGAQTLAVRRIYTQENLQVTSQGHEPDDFIATELEFAAYLLNQVRDSQVAKNDPQIQYYIDKYREFWGQHLSLWLGLFTKNIRQSTRHQVFDAISEILDTLITFNTHSNTKEAQYETIAT